MSESPAIASGESRGARWWLESSLRVSKLRSFGVSVCRGSAMRVSSLLAIAVCASALYAGEAQTVSQPFARESGGTSASPARGETPRAFVEIDCLDADERFPEKLGRKGAAYRADRPTKLRSASTLSAECTAAVLAGRVAVFDREEMMYVYRATLGDDRIQRLPRPRAMLESGETKTFTIGEHQLRVRPVISKDHGSISLSLIGLYGSGGKLVCRHDLVVADGKCLLFRFGPWVQEREVSRLTPPLLPWKYWSARREIVRDPECLLMMVTARIVDEAETEPVAPPTQSD